MGGEESPGEVLTHRSEQQPGFSEQGVAQPSFLAEPGCMCANSESAVPILPSNPRLMRRPQLLCLGQRPEEGLRETGLVCAKEEPGCSPHQRHQVMPWFRAWGSELGGDVNKQE